MIENKVSDRAKLNFSFDEEENSKKEEVKKKIEEISVKAGFNSKSPIKINREETNGVSSEKIDRRARTRTGRTYAFNTKIKPETYQKIGYLSDKLSEEQGRYVSLAEIIERAIDQLEKTMKSN